MSREEEKWRDDREAAGSDAGGVHSSPSDDELLRIWDELKPQTPSTRFSRRIAELVETLRQRQEQRQEAEWHYIVDDNLDESIVSRTRADLGAVLTILRERCQLSHTGLNRRLHVDRDVLIALERNALYPETLHEAFWRGYAAAVECRIELIAHLIASYDRTKISVSGSPAARSGPSMTLQQRATFLGQPDAEMRAQLDQRREDLLVALRRAP